MIKDKLHSSSLTTSDSLSSMSYQGDTNLTSPSKHIEEDSAFLTSSYSCTSPIFGDAESTKKSSIQTAFYSKIRVECEEDGSPTPTNAQPTQNESPIISIPSPVANLNPFIKHRQPTSPRPCVAGTQSVRYQKASDPSENVHSKELSFTNSNTSGIGASLLNDSSIGANDQQFTDSSLSEFLNSLSQEKTKSSSTFLTEDSSSFNSGPASAILNSILKESAEHSFASTNCSTSSSNVLDDNMAVMSKYVEELTGFTPSGGFNPNPMRRNSVVEVPTSIQREHNCNSTQDLGFGKRLNTLQNLYETSNQATRDLVAKYLASNKDGIESSGQTSLSPTSAPNKTGPGTSRVFNFENIPGNMPTRAPRNPTGGSNELSSSDAALLNTLSNMSPNALSALFKTMERSNVTNYLSTAAQPSLAQSLEALAALQQQVQIQQQLIYNYENKLNGNLQSTDLNTLLAIAGIQQNANFVQDSFNHQQAAVNGNQFHKGAGLFASSTPNRGNSSRHWSGSSGRQNARNQNADNSGINSYLSSDIELAATSYRNSASSVAQRSDVPMKWDGELPSRNYHSMSFSRKVFLGGVPWETTSDTLIQAFSEFGNLTVNWPQGGDHGLSSPSYAVSSKKPTGPKGYCYLIFDYEQSVSSLLSKCKRDHKNGEYYYSMTTAKLMQPKDVQVIPWSLNDSQYGKQSSNRSESTKTVFIGALHGMITAEALALIMSNLFGTVVYAAIDTDKYKYPIGSGRVIFANEQSYFQAVLENFVEVRTSKFNKIIQIDPYLEDAICSKCNSRPGIYFCRAFSCFSYFCPACWSMWHNTAQTLYNHKPLRRSWRQSGNGNERSGGPSSFHN